MRNFFSGARLHASLNEVSRPAALRQHRLFGLRSLFGLCRNAILGRSSSSSLPPLFVPGRFATLSYAAGGRHVR